MNELIKPIDLSDSANRAATNLTDSVTKNAGQTLGDIWFLVFGGISHAADKRRMKYGADLEKFRQEVFESVEQIPKEKKVEPSFQITAQALENSKYCVTSETLRGMFAKLITGTMHADFEPLTHPSFPEMIKQMSENDAYMLMELKRKSSSLPVAEFHEKFRQTGNHIPRYTNMFISDIFNIPLYECSVSLSSLERMGLISITYMEHIDDDTAYSPFYETPTYISLSKEIESFNRNSYADLIKGICNITPLGNQFIGACVL